MTILYVRLPKRVKNCTSNGTLKIGYSRKVHFRLWKRNTSSVGIVIGLGEPK